MGIPLDDLSIAIGMAISDMDNNNYFNFGLGIGMHILTGPNTGMIFASIIYAKKDFKLPVLGKELLKELFFQRLFS
jgi:hypothetical protein